MKRLSHSTFFTKTVLIVTAFLSTLVLSENIFSQQLAFPTAEGWGKFALGGRGGKVIEVTNLNDSGPGSLREAVMASGPRTVVFRVSGTIQLKSTLKIRNPYLTIAGQTAPGDGICLRDFPLDIGADNVIVRYLRVRLGDESGTESDAFNASNCNNVIIDHVSSSWSVDETFSLYTGLQNVTVQWCIMSESMRYSIHSKGAHGYGGIWGGDHVTYHHNLLAHHSSRNPRWDRGVQYIDHRNNVVYNWTFNSSYGGEAGPNGLSMINMVANYYKPGPSTNTGEKQYRIVEPSKNEYGYGKWYVAENVVEGYPFVVGDNWKYGVQSVNDATKAEIRVDEPFEFMPINQDLPEQAYERVLANAGCNLPRRDIIDTRIIWETRNDTALYGGKTGPHTGIIDSQNDVGGWPELNTAPAPVDSDHDGMPDEWELANNLNPQDAEDRNGDLDGDGYTNLEEYLNTIEPSDIEYILQPTSLSVQLVSTNSVFLKWNDNSGNEKGFRLERASDGDFTELAVLAPNTTVYSEENLPDYTTFRYRIQAFNDTLISAYSNVVEVTTSSVKSPPAAAIQILPEDKKTFVSLIPTLTWKSGLNSVSHDVYFGTTNPPPFVVNTADTFFTTDTLTKGTRYYWRIDEVNEYGKTESPVWSFSTTRDLPAIRIAYWKFDETSGTSVADFGGFGNNGLMVDMDESPWVQGISKNGLAFDGIDDRVVVQNNGLIDFSTESFSISLWAKVFKYSDGSMYLLSKGSFVKDAAKGTNGSWYGFELKGDEIRFAIDDNTNKSYLSVSGASEVLGDKWNHIAGIRDTQEDKVKLYINGKLLAETEDISGNISNNAVLLFGNSYELKTPFEGALDEIRMFNYALTGQQVLEIMGEFVTGVDGEIVPDSYVMQLKNYPNPFNPSTRIVYNLPKTSYVKLEIFDLLGSRVATLVDEVKTAGEHDVEFNAAKLSSGLYIYTLTTPTGRLSRKMAFIK